MLAPANVDLGSVELLGRVKASAANRPISSTAIIWIRVAGFVIAMSSFPGSVNGARRFSMK